MKHYCLSSSGQNDEAFNTVGLNYCFMHYEWLAGRCKRVSVYLIVENFHSTTSIVEEPENLVFDVQQLLLIRGNAGHEVVVTLF